MGITGLLRLLGNNSRSATIAEFEGQTVVVDAYCWLHKGAAGCATQLAKNEDTDGYVHYCMKYVKLLLRHNIKPIMVFDGRDLSAKKMTNKKRSDSKKAAKRLGMEALRVGNLVDAHKFFSKCIDITPQMAHKLIQACRQIDVDCIVAPYEADAQLAFFLVKGLASLAISEDSDLLVFGCQKVLYKMDINGKGVLVDATDLNVSLKMRDFTFEKFRYMCILSGCDYLESLPGIGLKKALKFLSMTAETNPAVFLTRIGRYLNMRQLTISESYVNEFLMANATFKHQLVYNPFIRQLVPFNPIEVDDQYCTRIGDYINNYDAYQIALGNIDPNTFERMDNWDPMCVPLNHHSIWSLNYRPRQRPPSLMPRKKPPIDYAVNYRPPVRKPEVEMNDQALLNLYKQPPSATQTSASIRDPIRLAFGNFKPVIPEAIVRSRFFHSNCTITSQAQLDRESSPSTSEIESIPSTSQSGSDRAISQPRSKDGSGSAPPKVITLTLDIKSALSEVKAIKAKLESESPLDLTGNGSKSAPVFSGIGSMLPNLKVASDSGSVFPGIGSMAPKMKFESESASVLSEIGSIAPKLKFESESASVYSGIESMAPKLKFESESASVCSGIGSMAPKLKFESDSLSVLAEIGSMAPKLKIESESASVFTGNGSISPKLKFESESASVYSGIGSMAPKLKFESESASVCSGIGSMAPKLKFESESASVCSGNGSLAPKLKFESESASVLAEIGSIAPKLEIECQSTTVKQKIDSESAPAMSQTESESESVLAISQRDSEIGSILIETEPDRSSPTVHDCTDSSKSDNSSSRIECECLLEIGDGEVNLGPEPLTSVENIPVMKKRKVSDVRKKRTFQMTIPNLFKKMKTD